ncbi:MAG: zinc transporter ZupT [Tissierellia bacterium]|nr:zinc transporter ZupT [Bacillota bacterium]NLL22223.1 zinc transporter ZupT [Tissierellia bacterium]
MNNVIFAFLLTLFAGLSTGVGSLISLMTKKTDMRFLATSLGFSAGVMIYISMIEIFPQAEEMLCAQWGEQIGSWATVAAFFGGVFLIAIIDYLVPEEENPHELNWSDPHKPMSEDLMRMGIFTALSIGIHNFPEGIATFMSALKDPQLGVPIAIAIAIHNIPEGIAVAVPVYYATGSRRKAFRYSFLSGLSEPLGALLAYFLLMPFLSDGLFGIVFAAVAGIMVYISVDELLPFAQKYGQHHHSIYGLIAGMMVMAVSLLIL